MDERIIRFEHSAKGIIPKNRNVKYRMECLTLGSSLRTSDEAHRIRRRRRLCRDLGTFNLMRFSPYSNKDDSIFNRLAM